MCELNWIPVSERYPKFTKENKHSEYWITSDSKPVLVQTKKGENFVAKCRRDLWNNETTYEWYSYGTGGRRMKVMSKVIAWAEFNKYEEI